MNAAKSGRVGGRRNPRGEVVDPESVFVIGRALMPSRGEGSKPRHYRTVEEVGLVGGDEIRYRCIDASCRGIVFKTAGAAALHRGAVHPGQSPRTADVERAAKKAAATASEAGPADQLEISYPAVTSLEPVKRRRGRPPADPVVAEDAWLDAAAPSIGASVVEFIDQVIQSRQRAVERANGLQAEAVRLRQVALEVQHHVNRINELIQGI
jgi:hypothetical protein